MRCALIEVEIMGQRSSSLLWTDADTVFARLGFVLFLWFAVRLRWARCTLFLSLSLSLTCFLFSFSLFFMLADYFCRSHDLGWASCCHIEAAERGNHKEKQASFAELRGLVFRAQMIGSLSVNVVEQGCVCFKRKQKKKMHRVWFLWSSDPLIQISLWEQWTDYFFRLLAEWLTSNTLFVTGDCGTDWGTCKHTHVLINYIIALI